MSIQIIDNFDLSLAKPIDNRFVVGALSFYTNKDSIPLKYNGLRIYDTTDSTPYIWTGATWSYDIDRISVNLDNNSNSTHYIPFVGATFGVNYIKTSDKGLKYNPLYSQVLLADGSVNTPTLSFSSSTNLGIYRVNSTTIGFASSGAKRFEISSTSATSSVPFSVNISTSGPAFSVSSTGAKRFEVTNTSATSSVPFSVNIPTSGPAFSVSSTGAKRFEVTNTSATSSVPFSVISQQIGNNAIVSFGDKSTGGGSYNPNGTYNSQFEFLAYSYPYAPSPYSASIFTIGTSVPTSTYPGATNSIAGTRIDFSNWSGYSAYGVRDLHYINTSTVQGRIEIGNYNNNSQFSFSMQGRTEVLGGGGLAISNNLSVNGKASIINNVSIGASSNTTISSGSDLFSSSVPKLEVFTGGSTGTYQELMTLRHVPGGDFDTPVLRRLGYIMKMSSEGTTETVKMGGMILESLNGWANLPSLHLVTANQKRLSIDYFGKVGIGTDIPKSYLHVMGLVHYADNGAALAAGLTEGAFYRTDGVVKVVIYTGDQL